MNALVAECTRHPVLSRKRGAGCPMTADAPAPILDVANIEVIYNSVVLVLKGVSLSVRAGAASSPCSAPTAPARRRR